VNSADLYDIGITASNEAWKNVPTGTDLQEARRISREAEISAVRNAVLEEAAMAVENMQNGDSVAATIRSMKS
jgi:hypothetical protein